MARVKATPDVEIIKAPSPLFMAEQVKLLPLATLKPYGRNARTHSRRQIKQLAGRVGPAPTVSRE